MDGPVEVPEALTDKGRLKHTLETLNSEIQEQEVRQRSCINSNIRFNDDNIEDDSRNPKVAIRKHDQDIESTEEDIEAADRSSMDKLENNLKELKTKWHIERKRNEI